MSELLNIMIVLVIWFTGSVVIAGAVGATLVKLDGVAHLPVKVPDTGPRPATGLGSTITRRYAAGIDAGAADGSVRGTVNVKTEMPSIRS